MPDNPLIFVHTSTADCALGGSTTTAADLANEEGARKPAAMTAGSSTAEAHSSVIQQDSVPVKACSRFLPLLQLLPWPPHSFYSLIDDRLDRDGCA